MRKKITLLCMLLCTVWGMAAAALPGSDITEKVTPFEDGGAYYIINSYGKFKTTKAMAYTKLDVANAQYGAFLFWTDWAKQDPRCIFTLRKSGNGYIVTAFDGNKFAGTLPKDTVITMTTEPEAEGLVQYFDKTEDGYYMIYNDSMTVLNKQKERVGHNYLYTDAHAYGGNENGHIGGNRFWTLEDSACAKWTIQKVDEADLAAAKAKTELASTVMTISNPNVYGTGGANADAAVALKEAWNAADAALKSSETADYEALNNNLIQAKEDADNSVAGITDGLYYIVNDYSNFPATMAMRFGQDDQNSVSNERAYLFWDELNKIDPRFVFSIMKMTDDGGFVIENYGTGWCIDGLSGNLITMSPEYVNPQFFMDAKGGTFYIHNASTGGNNMYPDSHGFGGGSHPNHVGANQWWTLDDNAAAKWRLEKLTKEEIAAISKAKLDLCKLMGTVQDPATFGQGELTPKAYTQLKDAYQAAKNAMSTAESDETYIELTKNLQTAIDESKKGSFTFLDGYYYIESAYSNFPETVAMAYDRIDNTGARLCYEPIVEGDPKFMFQITRTSDGQFNIQNIGSETSISWTGDQEAFVNYKVFMRDNGVAQKIEFNEDTTCVIYPFAMPNNRYYPDSHAFGENTRGHIGIGDAWAEVPEAAIWRLVPVSDDDMLSLFNEKLDLCKYLSRTFNPFVVGKDPGDVTQETYDAFNDAYTWATGAAADNTADEETCATFLKNLQEARGKADTEVLPIREGGLYYIVSKYDNYISTNRRKAMSYVENTESPEQSLVWRELTEGDLSFVFRFTAASDTSYHIQNLSSGKYISSLTTDLQATIVNSDSIAQIVTPIGFAEYRIGPASTLYRNRHYYLDATAFGGNEQGNVGANRWSMDCNNAWSLYTFGQEITIGESGYASVMLPFDCYVPDGVKAYVLTKPKDTADALTEVNAHTIAAGVPFIVAGAQGRYIFEVSPDEGTVPSDNLLKGSFIGTTVADNGKVFVLNKEKTGNLLVPNTGNVPVGEVYVEASGLTGIGSVVSDKTGNNSEVYDLQGRRVAKPLNGIYVKDGRKVILK